MSEQLNQEAYHAEFEAAYQKEFPVSVSLMMDKFDRDEHGDYKENCVYTAYHLWQAARRASAPASADVALPPLPKPAGYIPYDESGYPAEQVEQIRREAILADRRARQAVLDEQASVMLIQRKKIQKLKAALRATLSRQSSAAPEATDERAVIAFALDLAEHENDDAAVSFLKAWNCEDHTYLRANWPDFAEFQLAAGAARQGGNTSETGGRGNDIKSSETRMDTAFDGGRAAPALADAPQAKSNAQVGCERYDGLLNIHAESEKCEVCAKSTAAQPVEQTQKGQTK